MAVPDPITVCFWVGLSNDLIEKEVGGIGLCNQNVRPWTFCQMRTTEIIQFTTAHKNLPQILF